MKNKGIRQYRFEANPRERDFAVAWEHENSKVCSTHLLEHLLSEDPYRCSAVSDRDREVAATIIQWLGSPVGQGFVLDVMSGNHWGIKEDKGEQRKAS